MVIIYFEHKFLTLFYSLDSRDSCSLYSLVIDFIEHELHKLHELFRAIKIRWIREIRVRLFFHHFIKVSIWTIGVEAFVAVHHCYVVFRI